MRSVFLFVFVLVFASASFAQATAAGFDLSNYGVTIEPDKRVILVLATLDAARTLNEKGESTPVIKTALSEQGKEFRELLSSDLAAMNEGLRQRISTFVLAHKRRNPSLTDEQLIAPFISMAYTLTPAPEFSDPVMTSDLPVNLLDVLDFAPLVRDVYRTTNIGANLNEYIKKYQSASDTRLRPSAKVMVNDLLTYLHTKPQLVSLERVKTQTQKSGSKKQTLQNVTMRERERRFVIVPELLAPTGYVNFVNIKDDYFVVIPADTDLTNSEVRRAYLQFVVDPLVLANSKDIEAVRASIKQLLDERRKVDATTSPDVYLTITRSLVAAVDAKHLEHERVRAATSLSRQRINEVKTEAEKLKVSGDLAKYKQAMADETALRLSEDYQKGALLAFYFADQLKGVEDSEFDIASSMREMILSFDASKEAGRYETLAAARKRAATAREEQKKNAVATPTFIENPVTAKLLAIQETIKTKNYKQAEADLKLLLEQNPSEPRVFFNIGRVASLSAAMLTDPADADRQSAKLLEAKVAYENVIQIAAVQKIDPALVSLSYVALGRIYEFNDQKGYAIGLYDAAIKLGEVAGGGHKEAMAAKQRLLKDQ